jgi:hypothetical protein
MTLPPPAAPRPIQPTYADPGALAQRPQLQGAPPPQESVMPWMQQWRQFLQQQAAYQQQIAQQMHGLGPYSNALTGPAQIQQLVNSRRNEVMQYLMGAGGPRSLAPPGQSQ